MIQINNLTKQFSAKVLFQDLSFNLQKGERCGLVGRNGSGKSTLFSIILDQQLPDSGEVVIPKNYKVGHLEQHIHFTKDTVLEECCQVLAAEDRFDHYKAEKILTGLGFTDEDFHKSPHTFSGGYQIRINLCKSLLTEPNILLLDEPTNYLDIISLRWLRRFLIQFDGEVIIITHDRDFMDSVTTHTMGIHRKGLKKIKGDTGKFYEQVNIEEEIHEKTRLNQEKKKAHLEAFVDRFSAKASKATQAQSKKKQLDKMSILSKLNSEATMGLDFNYDECSGKQILSLENIAFNYPNKEILFNGINIAINRNDKIGIIGKNGKGKSTLLNIIGQDLNPTTGKLIHHPQLKQGHLGQTNVSRLSLENTVVEEVQSANLNLPQSKIRSICGTLMFQGDDSQKKIKVLSGGEKNRVLLAKIMANPTNMLLLDEPTNHLDMESIEILSDKIEEYPGAVILVTHSEALLRKTVNKLIIFRKDGAEIFLGSYDEFLEKIGWDEEIETNSQPGGGPDKNKTLTKKEIHSLRAEIIKERAKICNPLNKKMTLLEKELFETESKVESQNEALILATENGNNDEILKSSQLIGKYESELEGLFEKMEELEEQINSHSSKFDEKLRELD
ncbi:MAG: ATP-binding cassette subfamily F protein 3 [Bacteriovoracaceae bacterium]|jgi:ATP-binding cassette subfamily F protein 3